MDDFVLTYADTGNINDASFNPANDIDKDGIINSLDLDSDGDGCPDALEGGFNIASTSLVDSAIPGGNTGTNYNGTYTNPVIKNLGNTVGSTATTFGVPTIVGLGQGLGKSQIGTDNGSCVDLDADGISDDIDIDDDNDGTTDIDEMTCTAVTASKVGVRVTSDLIFAYNASTLQGLVDGAETHVIQYSSGTLVNSTWLKFEFNEPKTLTQIEIGHYPNQTLFTAASKYKIQGSNDNTTWVDIVSNQYYDNSAPILATNNSAKMPMPSNKGLYRFYRIQGISGAGSGWAQEVYFTELSCTDLNTDGDSLVNRLDLDSDGDACFDAQESNLPTAKFNATTGLTTGTVGANGMANDLELSTDNGVYNFYNSYELFAKSATNSYCVDSDADGYSNFVDLDDDNDGIKDDDEMTCATASVSKAGVIVSSGLSFTMSTGNLQALVDGVETYQVHTPTGTFANNTWLQFDFTSPKRLIQIEIGHFPNQTLFATTSTYKMQGSNDNTNWTDIGGTQTYNNTTPTLAANNSAKVLMDTNDNYYRYYRMYGISGSSGGGWVQEVYFTEKNCVSKNTDLDTLSNHLDLDSDGDGCSDALEGASIISATKLQTSTMNGGNSGTNYNGSSTGAVTSNLGITVGNTLETLGIPTIALTGQAVGDSQNASVKTACDDFDNDGITNDIDIDDDNDGVTDVAEMNCTGATASKTGMLVSSDLTFTYLNGGTSVQNLVDGSNTLQLSTPAGTFANTTWLKFKFPTQKVITQIEIAHANAQTLFTTTSTYKLQGSFDDVNWFDIVATQTYNNSAAVLATTNSAKLAMTNNVTPYLYYRVFGISGASAGGQASEIFFTEKTCLDLNSDADTHVNKFDLDSDEDGCFDARESGVTVSKIDINTGLVTDVVGENGLANNLETTTDTGFINYTLTYSKAISSAISNCDCNVVAATGTPTGYAKVGISVLSTHNTSNWPVDVPNAHLVLESKTKGFVITRMASPETSITDPKEGMIVWDTNDNCLKLYNGTAWICTAKSCNN